MLKQYVLTLIGDDKPGLIDSLASVVKNHEGNWLESRMANLAGKFSGIVLVSIGTEKADAFEAAVTDLKNAGLSVRATAVSEIGSDSRQTKTLTLLANDRPGILSELTSTLVSLGVNVEELTTDCSPAPMSNDLLFKASAEVSIPDDMTESQMRDCLEALADDLMVEFD